MKLQKFEVFGGFELGIFQTFGKSSKCAEKVIHIAAMLFLWQHFEKDTALSNQKLQIFKPPFLPFRAIFCVDMLHMIFRAEPKLSFGARIFKIGSVLFEI